MLSVLLAFVQHCIKQKNQYCYLSRDLLIAHYQVKIEKIAYKMREELEVIDMQIKMIDSFKKTFFHCVKQ